ncbi:MAG: hypothetical protein ACYC35_20050 [Pirellulales bacterium]
MLLTLGGLALAAAWRRRGGL